MNNKRNRKKTIIGTTALLFGLTATHGVYAYTTPAYTVSLDVNPGIVMEVNRFEQVIGIEAVNEDAENIIENINLENENINEAIAAVVAEIDEMGYLEGENRDIVLSTSSDDETEAIELSEQLEETISDIVEQKEIDAEISSKIVGEEMVLAAKELGITPGKYNIIVNHLGENAEEYKDVPVKELMKAVKEGRKAEISEKNEDTEKEDTDLDEVENEDLDISNEEKESLKEAEKKKEKEMDKTEKKDEKSKEKDSEDSAENAGGELEKTEYEPDETEGSTELEQETGDSQTPPDKSDREKEDKEKKPEKKDNKSKGRP